MKLYLCTIGAFLVGIAVGGRIINHYWEKEHLPRVQNAVELSEAVAELMRFMHDGFAYGIEDMEAFERAVDEQIGFINVLADL